ncbi:uncharacterized protein LOC128552840 [Mercenaria mercenaria]|uniref:uncharacterized protein LOC128552840 n=1 Tax=Mercenaria mercenaria TaxID=6596 RepID=UPI00234E9E21|nr:uncharacterized protein LOC128552840 [Mercenaria mercenaria]
MQQATGRLPYQPSITLSLHVACNRIAVKRKELTPEQKEIVIFLVNDGLSQRKIAEVLEISQSGETLFLKRYNARESVENPPRSGRPLAAGRRGDRQIMRLARSNRRDPLAENTGLAIGTLPDPISSRTVRRGLKFHKYTRRNVRNTLTINTTNRKRRVSWCKQKLHSTLNRNWNKVIFTDETQVKLDSLKRVSVWRKADEIWRPGCLGQHGGGCVSALF